MSKSAPMKAPAAPRARKPAQKPDKPAEPTHLRVARSDLAEALAFVTASVQRRPTVAVLANVMLLADPARLYLTATDLDMQAQASVPCQGLPFNTTVPAHTLSDIVKSLPEGAEITFAMDAENHRLEVACGRSRWRLATLDADIFPSFPYEGDVVEIELPASALREMIARTGFAVAQDAGQGYPFQGIYLHSVPSPEGARMRAAASNGASRVAVFDGITLPSGCDLPGLILPARALSHISGLCSGADEPARLCVFVMSGARIPVRASITVGTRIFTTKLIDAVYPDYQRVIPPDGASTILADREELIAEVSRITIISDGDARAVRIAGEGSLLSIGVRDTGLGFAQGEIAAEIDGGPILLSVNSRFLVDALKSMQSEMVTITLDQNKPFKLREGEDSAALHVISPLRL